MNERIQELVKLANRQYSQKYYPKEFLENFAKLIVQECADVELYWLSEQDRKSVAEKIKQHFGVENA